MPDDIVDKVFETKPEEQAPAVPEPAPSAAELKRERLLNNLKRGRLTALENRRKKGLAKRIEKEKKVKDIDDTIEQRVISQRAGLSELAELRSQIAELKVKHNQPPQPQELPPPPAAPAPAAPAPAAPAAPAPAAPAPVAPRPRTPPPVVLSTFTSMGW